MTVFAEASTPSKVFESLPKSGIQETFATSRSGAFLLNILLVFLCLQTQGEILSVSNCVYVRILYVRK